MNFKQFESLKKHFQTNKVSIYNHLINHTFDSKGIRVYALNRHNENVKNTRKESKGAHFRVTRWLPNKEAGAFEMYIYWTKSYQKLGEGFAVEIRADILSQLHYNTKIVFEFDNHYSKPMTKQEIKRKGYISEGFYLIPVEKVDFYTKQTIMMNGDYNYEDFRPEFIPFYSFKHDNHKTGMAVSMDGVSKTFESRKAFYEELAKLGAKANTLEGFIREHRNFTLAGHVFIIDPKWEVVEYKLRKRVKVIETVEEVVDDKVVSTTTDTHEEESDLLSFTELKDIYNKKPQPKKVDYFVYQDLD